ncbi:MAG TPA: hypothetical protein ENN07_03650 [candidate division Zixibacteria bacterium]|nr:hypothetical protein [candidate division Zixibacteria bacterium]
MKKALPVILAVALSAIALFAITETTAENAPQAATENVQQAEQPAQTATTAPKATGCPHRAQVQSQKHECPHSKAEGHNCSAKSAEKGEHKCTHAAGEHKCGHGKDGAPCGENCCKVTGDKSSCCSVASKSAGETNTETKPAVRSLGCGGSKN